MSNTSLSKAFDLPFALSIGPQRSATTWIDRYLRARGDVCLPDGVKETFFFDRHYDRGTGFYESHFKPESGHKLIAEITATSFDWPEAPQRVHGFFGKKIRFICPLRDPVVRSYSLYLHYLRYGLVTGSLRDAVQQIPQILESSYYAVHLSRWFDLYGADHIKILYQEDLENDQDLFVRNVCEGLGLDYIEPTEDVQGKYNVTTYSRFSYMARFAQYTADFLRAHKLYGPINFAKKIGIKRLIFGAERPDASPKTVPEEDQKWLQDLLNPEIERLEKLLGSPISQWKS